MEIHLIYLLYFTALCFTVIAYYAKNNWSFAVIAAVGWIIVSMSLGEITYIGFDGMGSGHAYTIQAGDPGTSSLVGFIYYLGGIGLVLLILTIGWVFMSREVGDEV
jgi:hypothetical protein